MSEKKRVMISLDTDSLDAATDILGELGLTLSAAVDIYLKAVIRENGVPFTLKRGERIDYTTVSLKESK